MDRLRLCFKEEDIDTILKIHNGLRPGVDWWIWTRSPNGRFSVSWAYNCVVNEGPLEEIQRDPTWSYLWKAKIHNRHKLLWWAAAWDIIRMRGALGARIEIEDRMCPICGEEEELSTHLFLFCRYTRPIWFMSRWSLRVEAP